MPRSARQTPYVRFASASLLAVVLVGTAFCMLGLNMVTARERHAASDSAAALAGEPLLAVFDGVDVTAPVSDEVRARADILGGDVAAVERLDEIAEVVQDRASLRACRRRRRG